MRDIITKLEQLNVEKEQLNEGLADMAHEAEKDHEVQMARSDCYKSAKYAVAIHKMLKDVSEMEGIDGWVAAKITKAADYLGSVKHYMEGQAMSDVELAVVPVAGDMTDAMTVPEGEEKEECRYCGGDCPNDEDNACDGYLGDIDGLYAESVEEVYENKASVKHVDKLLSLAPQRTPGDIICDIMHWAEANNMDIDDIVKQGKMYYNDDKFMRGDDIDEEVTEAEERDYICVHAKKGKYECSGTSSYAAAKKAAEHWGLKSTAGIDAHLADKEKTATENIEEGRNDGPMSECCDAPLDGFENGLGRCSDCGEMAGAWNADELDEDEDVIGNIIKNLPKDKHSGSKQADVIGDIIAKLPKDSDEKTVNMPSLPKSKPERTPTVSAVAQQAAANKAVRSMAQDTTRPLRQSKFSEWSKK